MCGQQPSCVIEVQTRVKHQLPVLHPQLLSVPGLGIVSRPVEHRLPHHQCCCPLHPCHTDCLGGWAVLVQGMKVENYCKGQRDKQWITHKHEGGKISLSLMFMQKREMEAHEYQLKTRCWSDVQKITSFKMPVYSKLINNLMNIKIDKCISRKRTVPPLLK